jgi:hypothetical protein
MLPHGTMIRLAPPLVISQDDLDWGLDRIEDVLLQPGVLGRQPYQGFAGSRGSRRR